MSSTVCVILPCFSKASEIEETLRRLILTLEGESLVFRLLLVLDGPDAECVRNVQKIEDSRVEMIVLPVNNGKGGALRVGFNACDADFVAFLDADLDIHPNSIVRAINILSNPNNASVACVYGSKFHDDSEVEYPIIRRVASSVYRQLIRIMFGLNVDDTQTGVKVFRYDTLKRVITHSKENRFLFDVELMAIHKNLKYKMIPMPVSLNYQYSSSINLFTAAIMIKDTLKLAWRIHRSNLVGRSK